jgi:hypothetical protein
MSLSQAVSEVIALSTAIRKYWDTELPKRHPHYPVVAPGEDSGPAPPERDKLKDLLTKLPEELVYKIALLMYLGRGDFGTDDLATHYESLKQRYAKPEWAISQMMGKAPLADYLADGVAELKKSGIELDDLAFEAVDSGK